MEITSYLEGAVTSELSGNVVDLCPVGALVSKPYSFEARPWELRKVPGIDVMDAVGTNIRIDHRFREVMRALPRLNEEVNEEWAHDKTRHCVDGLVRNRLDRPWVRRDGKLQPATWDEAFAAIAAQVDTLGDRQIGALAGDLQDVESMFALKKLLNSLGSTLHECRIDEARFDISTPAAYRFNSTIAGIETAPTILLVGTNPRWEAPLVNTRIRKAVKAGARVFRIGPAVDLTYPVTELGADINAIGDLPREVREAFEGKENAAVIVGMGVLPRPGVYEAARAAASALGATFNLLHNAASRVGALDIGFTTGRGLRQVLDEEKSRLGLMFLLGADEGYSVGGGYFEDSFNVYIGTHGDRGVVMADVILPGAAYTEKHGTYVNLEGRVQLSEFGVHPPGEAREDWTIIRALSDVLGKTLPFDSLAQLRAAIAAEVPRLGVPGLSPVDPLPAFAGSAPNVSGEIVYPIEDFYLTNPIARASPTLQRCSAEILHGQSFQEAAE
jgi:NADH-quinone oxidoreductase subunit G